MSTKRAVSVSLIGLTFLALALAWAATRMPICDEAFYGVPGRNLAFEGATRSPMLETAGRYLTRLDRITYWEMPLHLVLQSVWYRAFGASIFSLRTMSAIFALLGLLSWIVVVARWTERWSIALITGVLLSVDYFFLSVASVGRSDATSFGLAFMAVAVFELLHVRRFALALLCSHALTAMAGLTHPLGGVVALGGVVYLQLFVDKRRWQPMHLVAVVAPYAIGAIVWLAYIFQDPIAFRDQFFGNSAGRLWPLLHPLNAIADELIGHYLSAFGGVGVRLAERTRLIILAFYATGIAATYASSTLRKRAGIRILQRLLVIDAAVLFLIEGAKQPPYMVYLMPQIAALSAVVIEDLLGRWRTQVVLGALAGLCLFQFALSAYTISRNAFSHKYTPAVRFLKWHANASAVIIAPAELSLEVPP